MNVESNDASAQPIFVVGASRSGTALVQSALNNHPDIHLAGESHYFDDLRPRMRGMEHSGLDADARRRCEDYFLALGHRPYGHGGDPAKSRIAREDLRTVAGEIGTGSDAYFTAFCLVSLREKSAGSTRWGEKTPRHIYRIPDILDCFPSAKVICLVRDPRAVVASYRHWRHQGGFDFERDPGHEAAIEEDLARARRSYHLALHSLLWRSTANAATSGVRRFGPDRVRIQPYEELVTDPEGSLRGLAAWLDVDYSPAMLDVPVHNSSFSTFASGGGMTSAPLHRWREHLTPREIAVVQALCGPVMAEHGYELETATITRGSTALAWLTLPSAAVRAVLANRSRIGNLPSYVWRRAKLLRAA